MDKRTKNMIEELYHSSHGNRSNAEVVGLSKHRLSLKNPFFLELWKAYWSSFEINNVLDLSSSTSFNLWKIDWGLKSLEELSQKSLPQGEKTSWRVFGWFPASKALVFGKSSTGGLWQNLWWLESSTSKPIKS